MHPGPEDVDRPGLGGLALLASAAWSALITVALWPVAYDLARGYVDAGPTLVPAPLRLALSLLGGAFAALAALRGLGWPRRVTRADRLAIVVVLATGCAAAGVLLVPLIVDAAERAAADVVGGVFLVRLAALLLVPTVLPLLVALVAGACARRLFVDLDRSALALGAQFIATALWYHGLPLIGVGLVLLSLPRPLLPVWATSAGLAYSAAACLFAAHTALRSRRLPRA